MLLGSLESHLVVVGASLVKEHLAVAGFVDGLVGSRSLVNLDLVAVEV